MSDRPPPYDMAGVAWDITRAAGRLLLGQMRAIEEQVDDPATRWQTLRTALERFAATERPGGEEGG